MPTPDPHSSLIAPQQSPTRLPLGYGLSLAGHVAVVLALVWLGFGPYPQPDVTVYHIALVGEAVAAASTTAAATSVATAENSPPPAASTPPKQMQVKEQQPTPQPKVRPAPRPKAQPKVAPKMQPSPAVGTAAGQNQQVQQGEPAQGAQGTQQGQQSQQSLQTQQTQQAQQGQQGQATVYTVQQVDRPPSVVRRATPSYPPEARKKALEGRVVVRLVVDAAGQAMQCTVHSAQPEGVFEAAALEAVQRMRFAPGQKAGRPVSTLVLLPFDFRLRR